MVFLAEYAGKLVHDAAVHSAVVVLGALTYAGEFEFIDAVAVEKVVESEGEATFECCRRAETCAEGHVAGKDSVEAFDLAAAFEDFAAYTEYIACP